MFLENVFVFAQHREKTEHKFTFLIKVLPFKKNILLSQLQSGKVVFILTCYRELMPEKYAKY